MIRILCFGDSLTWGYDPETRSRLEEDSRWPCVMREKLGAGYRVIEEGQNGRTIATEDPAEGEKNGLRYLGPCLESHSPLDYIILMLGTNDCKRKFSYSAMDIAGEMQIMLEKIQAYNHFRCNDTIRVLLVSPPHISDAIRDSWLGDSFGFENAKKLSEELAPWYQKLAELYGCAFVNAAQSVHASAVDGVHLDRDAQRKLGKTLARVVRDIQTHGDGRQME